ncbi:MAG: glycosyltransferase family 2 protein [Planctomycetes bacterium]|nr:glycosyltransferase family 2 protein [Planctomycetota bacterium]MCB9904173.1 glycosyltransferase family 2 protein [Planctomycetota bacterium]
MKLSVVITSWNTRALLRRCLDSVAAATDGLDAEVIVVDNGSADGSAELVAMRYPSVVLLRNAENLGYAIATNQGARAARGEYLLLLNSDTELDRSALDALIGWLDQRGDYAGAAPRLLESDGSVQRACMRFPRRRTAFAFGTPLERARPRSRELDRYYARDFDYERDGDVEQPPAACLLLRRSAWDELGGMDESLWLFFNDVDLCARLAEGGGRLRFIASATVRHVGGASTARFTDFVPQWQGDRLRYYRKYFGAAGVACVKLAVTWTYLDWALRTAWASLRGKPADSLAPTSRAFASFLFCG